MAEIHRTRAPGGRSGWGFAAVVLAAAALAGLIGSGFGCGASRSADRPPTTLVTSAVLELPQEMPADFGFVLRYGYGGFGRKNVLDTFAGTFAKDMIVAPPITTELRLSPDELALIYRRMVDIKIDGYPPVFRPDPDPDGDGMISCISPYQSSHLDLRVDGREVEIDWEDEHQSQAPEATALRGLLGYIQQVIESHDEYKALPQPQGAYD